MNISLNLLKKYIDLNGIGIDDIKDAFMEHIIEIDDIVDRKKDFENIIVGKIEKVEKHPNADKLNVCHVRIKDDDGLLKKIFNKDEKDSKKENAILQIVCGGNNVKEGMHVVVALKGALVKWHGEGELVEIENTELRGIKSFGMICASSEIGLSDIFPQKNDFEIIDLDKFKDKLISPIKIGENIADLLGYNDVIIEIDNKAITNRPDLWGHYGLARELSAVFNKPLKNIDIDDINFGKFTQVKIYIEASDLCKTYNVVKISNITVTESPKWLRDFIVSFGLNPINNIVDLANYVMYELGQPLHTFDANKITNKIFVRMGNNGEEMKSLDNTELKIDESMMVIADSLRPIAIAGIIGSIDSSVKETTNSIVLEAATFDHVSIRKTMQKLGFRTDAGARYEKQVDPELAILAMNRFLTLLKTICPRASFEMPLNFSNVEKEEKEIFIDFDSVRLRIGADIDDKTMVEYLTRLGFIVKEVDKNITSVTVPSFRNKDIDIKEDIIEEIARMYGYSNIEPQPIKTVLSKPNENELRVLERKAKNFMIANGFSEVLNYSFVSSNDLKEYGINKEKTIELLNSLTVDQNILRNTLVINLIKNVKDNLRFTDHLNIFEIGRIFNGEIESKKYENLPMQDYYFSGVLCKNDDGSNNFYELKEILNKFLGLFKLNYEYEIDEPDNIPSYCHEGRYANIFIGKTSVGYISELNPEICLKNKIKQRIAFFEIDFEILFSLINKEILYKQISKFQKSEIDLSIIVDKDILWSSINRSVLGVSELIESAKLFDVYTGDKIGEDKKSLAFRMVFSNSKRNLNQEEIDTLWKEVYEKLNKEFGAEIRK